MDGSKPTQFAPAERADPETVRRQADAVGAGMGKETAKGGVPALTLVLNAQRQIVYANPAAQKLMSRGDPGALCGRRPGEALDCAHAAETESGCGTTAHCRTCGAVLAILAAQGGEEDVRECRISKSDREALDLRVWTMPIEFKGETYTVFSALDVADEKRRRALERVFFHDILNAAAGLRGLSELVAGVSAEEAPKFNEMIRELAGKLIEDIQAQRDLANAENHEYVAKPAGWRTGAALEEVFNMYRGLAGTHGVRLEMSPARADGEFCSDKVLVRRVLGNLIKNAVEASQPGDAVTVDCAVEGEVATFSVHNPAAMPEEARLQMFQRSFSTKGGGRGLGTYSVKLFAEKYLGGKASFRSEEGEGTTFYVALPREWGAKI